MKKAILIVFCFLTLMTAGTSAQVQTGIEVLRNNEFRHLNGKRVALITNPTGVDSNLRSTADILHEAPQVKLKALLAPEHGIRGNITAGAKVTNSIDAATGVPVYSLYGSTKKPTREMLRDVDAIVYDIQDIGCRSYTFISTLDLCMKACLEQGKEFVVLDRPNPLGGERVEGPMVDDDCRSFVSQCDIPYVYGLTPGELAIWLNKTVYGDKVRLTVVQMEGWKRKMTFEDTGLPWVLPSPHIPTPATSLYYPATGIAGELSYASIGVGYTEPFKLFCAEWVDADSLANRLNALKLEGIRFRPIHIRPYYGFGQGKDLHGVEIYIENPRTPADLTLIQFYILQELADLYPERAVFRSYNDASRLRMFDKVVGTKKVRELFSKNHRVADILPLWQNSAAKFRKDTEPIRLY